MRFLPKISRGVLFRWSLLSRRKTAGFNINVCRTLPSVHRVLGIDVDAALTVVQDGFDVANGGHLVEVIHSMIDD